MHNSDINHNTGVYHDKEAAIRRDAQFPPHTPDVRAPRACGDDAPFHAVNMTKDQYNNIHMRRDRKNTRGRRAVGAKTDDKNVPCGAKNARYEAFSKFWTDFRILDRWGYFVWGLVAAGSEMYSEAEAAN